MSLVYQPTGERGRPELQGTLCEPDCLSPLGAEPVAYRIIEILGDRPRAWVGAYRTRDWNGVRSRLSLWNKGGGRVLPGLKRRRREEADVILLDKWPRDLRVASGPAPADPQFSSFVVSISPGEIAEIRAGFRRVGFEPGTTAGKIERQAVLDFQRHYGLTVDGLIGKQTLSALPSPAAMRPQRPSRRSSPAFSATRGSP